MKLLPALGLTVAGVFLLQKVSAASATTRMNFLIGKVSVQSLGITPILLVTVVAQNPTNSSFAINSVVANVFLNGSMIGNAAGFTPVTVQANTASEIPLNVTLNGLTIFSDIVNILNGTAGISTVIGITGTANVDNILIPINITYKLI